MSSTFETHKAKIDEIFKPENILAINAFLSEVRPPYGGFVKENEFQTIVKAAQQDAIDDFIKAIINYSMNKIIHVQGT